MKTAYEEELERRIEALETKYGYLKEKYDELDQGDFLEAEFALARRRLGELRGLGGDAWGEVKSSAEDAWENLESAFGKLKERLRMD